jgi:hypothetical protein
MTLKRFAAPFARGNSILAAWQTRIIGFAKVQNSTLHRKQSRYPLKIRIFCLERSAGITLPAASMAKPVIGLPETIWLPTKGWCPCFMA